MNRIICWALPLLLAGCANDGGLPYRSAGTLGRAQVTLTGTIMKVTKVRISGGGSGGVGKTVGTAAGGAAGAAAGAALASNNRLAGALVGGALGSTGGFFLGRNLAGAREGFEYVVRASNGMTYTMVQPPDVVLYVGQRVIIIMPDDGGDGKLLPAAEF